MYLKKRVGYVHVSCVKICACESFFQSAKSHAISQANDWNQWKRLQNWMDSASVCLRIFRIWLSVKFSTLYHSKECSLKRNHLCSFCLPALKMVSKSWEISIIGEIIKSNRTNIRNNENEWTNDDEWIMNE